MPELDPSSPFPPYVSFSTFINFIEGLRGQVPSVIDRSLMRSISGSLQAQLLSTLRYLQLVDEKGVVVNDKLANLVNAPNPEEQKAELRKILRTSYPYIFTSTENFSLDTGTPNQLSRIFSQQGPTGDTLRKVEKFFLAAATYAGEKMSPYIQAAKPGRTKAPRTKSKKAISQKYSRPITKTQTDVHPSTADKGVSNAQKWFSDLEGFLERLPNHDSPTWSEEEKKRWFDMFEPFLDFNIQKKE